MNVRPLGIGNLADVTTALKIIKRVPAQLLVVFDDPLTDLHRDAIVRAVSHRLPVISDGTDWAKAGAVLTYAAVYYEMY